MLCSFTYFSMMLCVFNPEHDLCLAKGRWNYVPPRSAVDFARRDASLMQVLYPDALCCSVYDLTERLSAFSDETINAIRELQHRSTVLPLQSDCREVHSVEEMESMLREHEHWVMKAPWSGAGRGLRWVHGSLTSIDRDWLVKTVASQRCVIAEPRREVIADVALEYMDGRFFGYSYFKTGSGVYKENIAVSDAEIECLFPVLAARQQVEPWLAVNVWPRYCGPLGVDLMVCTDGSVHVAEINFRHTMGMVAHAKINQQ